MLARGLILARRQNHLLGHRREVGGAGSMARAFVMAGEEDYAGNIAQSRRSRTEARRLRWGACADLPQCETDLIRRGTE